MTPLLTATSSVMCPHGGMAKLLPSQSEVLVRGAAVLLQSERHTIVGCVFAPGGVPSPCISIQWLTGTLQAQLRGTPMLLQSSVGLCLNALQAPQGTAIVVQVQTEALGA